MNEGLIVGLRLVLCTRVTRKVRKMDYTTLAVGVFALLFGVCTLILRFKNQEKLGKLNVMKEKFGDRTGVIIHTVSYTVIPIVAGVLFIVIGLRGGSVFGG